MDQAGIHRAIVVPEDREIVALNESGNRRVAEISRQSQGRFIPACTVNPCLASRHVRSFAGQWPMERNARIGSRAARVLLR